MATTVKQFLSCVSKNLKNVPILNFIPPNGGVKCFSCIFFHFLSHLSFTFDVLAGQSDPKKHNLANIIYFLRQMIKFCSFRETLLGNFTLRVNAYVTRRIKRSRVLYRTVFMYLFHCGSQ
jgi:hypothetical protein